VFFFTAQHDQQCVKKQQFFGHVLQDQLKPGRASGKMPYPKYLIIRSIAKLRLQKVQ
jgi:hypothetical protein